MSAVGTYEVVNELGLHARAAAALVQVANGFQSTIHLVRDGDEVNAKSIMGVLTLAAAKGTEVAVRCEGPDETAALAAVGALFENGFGEL
jgi:phosphocarrier protein HPr